MGSWNNWQGLIQGAGSQFGSQATSITNGTLQQYYYVPLQQQALTYNELVRRYAEMLSSTQNSDAQEKHRAVDATPEDEGMEGFTGMLNTFLVGCDPEFAALDSRGNQINLSNFVRGDGEIGFDHGGRVGEFRPEPTKGTYALTKRLQRLIKSSTIERIAPAKLRAGARVGRDCLGGHVHLGFPMPPNSDGKLAALDRVTQVLEALDILPQAESNARRAGGGYGRYGDVRNSGGHTEYRTMASWLTDPKVAYLCLTAAKLAACDPKGVVEMLPVTANFNQLVEWFRAYRSKDINARRALDRVLSLGHKAIQVYPDVDFRERWRELGL